MSPGYIGLFKRTKGLVKGDKETILITTEDGKLTTSLLTTNDNVVNTEVDDTKTDLDKIVLNRGAGDGVLVFKETSEAVIVNASGTNSGEYAPGDQEPDWGINYFPSVYSNNWTPTSGAGFFVGHKPDGLGGKQSYVEVNEGLIAGWTIKSTHLAKDTGVDTTSSGMAPADYPFFAGAVYANRATAPFRVTPAGVLVASDATITGSITADTGDIGGWSITATTIQSLSGSVGIILDSSVPVIKVGNTAGNYIEIDGANQRIQSSIFASGATGSRWDTATGDIEVNNLVARGNISATTLVFQEQAVTRGSALVTKSGAELFASTTATGTTFTVKVRKRWAGDPFPFAANDIILLKNATNTTWATVGAGSDQTDYWQYTATYQSGSSSATYPQGVGVANYGISGDGGLKLSADESNTPFMDIFTHAGSPWSTITTNVRIGNLSGINDPDLGGALSGFGLYSENVYLKGNVTLASGTLKTNATGQRVEIVGSDNRLYFYSSADNEIIRFGEDVYTGGLDGMLVQFGGVIYFDESTGTGNYTFLTAGVLDMKVTSSGSEPANVVGVIERNDLNQSTWGLRGLNQPNIDTTGQNRIGVAGETAVSGLTSTAIAIGIYGKATNAGSGAAWAGYFDNGNVYIANTLTIASLTASRALISNGSSEVAVSAVTSTELGYVSGVTSAIQTQLNGKEPTVTDYSISGTTNQVIVTGAGRVRGAAVTLSLPQSIDTAASVTFGQITVDGTVWNANSLSETNALFTLDFGTGGVRLNDVIGIDTAPNINRALDIQRTYTATGDYWGIREASTITLPTTGDNAGMIFVAPTFTNQSSVTAFSILSGVRIQAFDVALASGSRTINALAGLYIVGAPTTSGAGTTTVTNGSYAFFVDDGDSRLDGNILVSNGKFIGISSTEERIEFDATNGEVNILGANVGIGTTSPGARLDVANSAATSIIRLTGYTANNSQIEFMASGHTYPFAAIRSQNTGADIGGLGFFANSASSATLSERMRITADGNVGIRTANPVFTGSSISSAGGVELSLSAPVYRITRTGGGARSYGLEIDSNGAFYISDHTAGAGNQRITILATGEVGIGVKSPSWPLTVKNSASGASNTVVFIADDDGAVHLFGKSATDDAYFNSYDGGGTIKARIDANGDSYFTGGNVGIGTASPDVALDVKTGGFIHVKSEAASGNPGIKFATGTTNEFAWNLYNWNSDHKLYLDYNGADVMTIQSNGNVGIGVTDPDHLLEVKLNGSGTVFKSTGYGDNTGIFFSVTGGAPGTANLLVKNLESAAASTDINMDGSWHLHLVTSSVRFKDNVHPLEIDTSAIYSIPIESFRWRYGTANPGMEDFGPIAEQVYQVFPQVVNLDEDGMPFSLRTQPMMWAMLNEVQKLKEDLDEARTEIYSLKQQIAQA